MKPFFAQIERDLLISWQNRQDLWVMLVFFVIIIALFPLAIGANATVLDPLGVPVIWIAALLAILAGLTGYLPKMFAMVGLIKSPLVSWD